MWTDHDEESRDELPTVLRPYVRALRAPVPVRAAWRESLLREIASEVASDAAAGPRGCTRVP